MNELREGTYACWRVVSNMRYGTGDTAGARRSAPITTRERALEAAEKMKADIDNYHGPYYATPWVWTNRRRDLYFLSDSLDIPDEIAWNNGRESVAVVRDSFTVL